MRRVRHEAAWAADTALSRFGVQRALHKAAVLSYGSLASAVRRASGGTAWCCAYGIFTQGLFM